MTCSANAAARNLDGGASHTAPNPTPRKGVTSIMLRIRLRRYRDALGKNNSAAGATSHLVQSSPASRFTLGAANRGLEVGRQVGRPQMRLAIEIGSLRLYT